MDKIKASNLNSGGSIPPNLHVKSILLTNIHLTNC